MCSYLAFLNYCCFGCLSSLHWVQLQDSTAHQVEQIGNETQNLEQSDLTALDFELHSAAINQLPLKHN